MAEDKKNSKTEATEEPVKRGRGRPRKNPVEAEAVDQPKRGRGRPRKVVPEGADEKPKRPRGRPRKDAAEAAPAPAAKAAESKKVERAAPQKASKQSTTVGKSSSSDDLPIPQWRPRSEVSEPVAPDQNEKEVPQQTRKAKANDKPEPKAPARSEKSEKPKQEARKSRQRQPEKDKLEDRTGEEIAPTFRKAAKAPAPAALKPVEEEKVLHVVRIPSDAPQVIMRETIPTLVRESRAYPPIFFFANVQDETRLETVLEQIRMASEAGVHVFQVYVDFEVNPKTVNDSVAFAGYLLQKVVEVDAEAQVIFRIAFSSPAGWEHRFKKGRYTLEAGGLAEPSLADNDYWQEAEDCLRSFIKKTRQLPLAQHIMGLHLERGEWFQSLEAGYDTSIAAQDAFRNWARTRYQNDQVALCAAWFDGQAQFETISVPDFQQERRGGEEFVQTGRKSRRWVDYHLFLSDLAVERVGQLVHATKEASDGYYLVGVSYGYTFEWSHPSNGHLSLGKLLRNPEIDFVAGPPSYRNREPGGTCSFPCPIDSIALNGKLYISEEDFKTPISGRNEPDDFNPVMKTPQALESVHWRGFGAASSHKAGVCWMDLWGNGWLKTAAIWDRAATIRRGLIYPMIAQVSEPEVAVFIDERSLSYLVDPKAFELLVQNVRESILRSGLSVGFYLLSDLAHREQFPEAKLYVFLNAWDIRPEVRGAIKSRLQRDGKVLFWLYSAGLFDSGRDALERVREVTGIALKRQPFSSKSGTILVHRKDPLCEALPDKVIGQGSPLEPSYFAIPEEDTVILGEYSSTGLPSFVLRDIRSEDGHRWVSVFLGEPVVTPALFRALGLMARAHIWNHQEDLVHAIAPFVTVHCKGAGYRNLVLPDKWHAYNLTSQQWMQLDGTQVRFQAADGSTHCFLVGLKSEIEALLRADEAEALSVPEIPERPSNTLRLDEIQFDIPIMRLDTWVEDSWNEDISDDLILKPSQLDLDGSDSVADIEERFDTSKGNGRRRVRRRTKNRDKSSDGGSKDFDIMEMNVVFRKRD